MVTQELIIQLVNVRVKKLLDVAELSFTQEKYPIFRKIALDEFGKSGFVGDLERIWRSKER